MGREVDRECFKTKIIIRIIRIKTIKNYNKIKKR